MKEKKKTESKMNDRWDRRKWKQKQKQEKNYVIKRTCMNVFGHTFFWASCYSLTSIQPSSGHHKGNVPGNNGDQVDKNSLPNTWVTEFEAWGCNQLEKGWKLLALFPNSYANRIPIPKSMSGIIIIETR